MQDKINKKRGFTLIELLVVISIISLLSSVVLSAVGDARNKAKWRAFDSDIIQIKTAIQLYRESNNGNWPPSLNIAFNDLSELLNELNNDELYNKTELVDPNNQTYSLYYGHKTRLDDYLTCGSSSPSDEYYIIYTCPGSTNLSNTIENSSTMGQLYYMGYEDDSCVCTEIR